MERENIFILLYRRDTWTKTLLVLCLHANTMSGVFFWSLVQIPSPRDGLLDQEGGAFFPLLLLFWFCMTKMCFGSLLQNTLDAISGAQKLQRAPFLSGSSTQSSLEDSFRSHFFFLHLLLSTSSSFFTLWVLDDCQLWIGLRKKKVFCVVIYVLWCWYCT